MTHPPRALPGRNQLPWASAKLNESAAVVPGGDALGRGSACARGAGTGTGRGAGTSVTARSQSAGGKFAVGRRRGGRPSVASRQRRKPSTLGPNARAVSEPSRRLKLLRNRRLLRRVVTQRKKVSTPLCDRPGCHEPPLKSVRNPARYCSRACRQAVRNVQDRERKWRSRGTLQGRMKRHSEYQEAQRRQSRPQRDASAGASARDPPK